MEEITEAFDTVEIINVCNEGVTVSYCDGEEPFGIIMDGWRKMTSGARQMPAFGVSINNLTVDAMKKDLWIEFDFGKPVECSEMPFEKLLVQAEKGFSGFNLIRYTSGYGYDGRCFYLDLDGDMTEFCELLLNL